VRHLVAGACRRGSPRGRRRSRSSRSRSSFPVVSYGHGARSGGLRSILAWPLECTISSPDRLVVGSDRGSPDVVLIPLGSTCRKGLLLRLDLLLRALAETLGDTHRHKMPHGPLWNRPHMIGQGHSPGRGPDSSHPYRRLDPSDGNVIDSVFDPFFKDKYKWVVDVFLAGSPGLRALLLVLRPRLLPLHVPAGALMHVYARFSRSRSFRTRRSASRATSCTLRVCHQAST